MFNYAWSGATTIASIVALVLLWDDPGSTTFVLTTIGLGVWVVGILVVSNVWKTPTYKMIAWPGTPRRCLRTGRRHDSATSRSTGYQLATTWAAFALFLVALISLQHAERRCSDSSVSVCKQDQTRARNRGG